METGSAENDGMDKIAICVSTYNRRNVFLRTIGELEYMYPRFSKTFVVEDGGAYESVGRWADYRFTERVGIPRVKNKCLELAMDWGADHIFLFDDDCYPIADDWHLPYIQSGQRHLCYTFLQSVGKVDGLKIHALGNGCMMYFTRHCIETVGGFDTDFGYGKFEHTEFSHRIHNAGLTKHVFMDVIGSDKLFHSMDEYDEVLRTMTNAEMDAQMKRNAPLFNAKRNDRHFKPYRTLDELV